MSVPRGTARRPLVLVAGRRRSDNRVASISAGLDYPSVWSEHAWLRDTGKATYESVTDVEAMDAFALLSRTEGIIPAIESAMQLLVH